MPPTALLHGTTAAHNRLDALERELVTSHLHSCPSCTAQAEFLRAGKRDMIPTFGAMCVGLMEFLYERAVLIWLMRVAVILVVVTVTIADYLYLRRNATPTVPAVRLSNVRFAAPAPLASPPPLKPRIK